MACAIQYVDELVRDYLLYRGFVSTLKSFEVDQKNDRTRAMRADKIVESLAGHIDAGELETLRDTWHHLDTQMFRRLEHSYQNPVRKMELGLYRFYLVTCVSTGKADKVSWLCYLYKYFPNAFANYGDTCVEYMFRRWISFRNR